MKLIESGKPPPKVAKMRNREFLARLLSWIVYFVAIFLVARVLASFLMDVSKAQKPSYGGLFVFLFVLTDFSFRTTRRSRGKSKKHICNV